tara:strand:+ start:808 stop:1911 length:1104 start_codon:yes stop_codon:yes gene_type:complete
MKIQDIKVDVFEWKGTPWKTNYRNIFGQDVNLSVIRIITDEGIEGNSFLGSSKLGSEHHHKGIVDFAKELLIGRNPQDISKIWNDLWKMNRSLSLNAIASIDIALWDINGKISNQPIHRLLGTCKEKVPVYSSTAFHENINDYVKEAITFMEAGWTAHKIHPHGIPDIDIKICQEIRKSVDSKMKLMLDSMCAYQYEDALRVGKKIEDLNFYWYEDPLVEEDIYNYKKLYSKLDIPIVSTEFIPGKYYSVPEWITQKTTNIVRGDVVAMGGISPLKRLTDLADAFNMKCEIHSGSSNSLDNVANLHVIIASTNCEFYEFFPCSGENRFGLSEEIEFDNGYVSAPNKPGLGFEIAWKDLNKTYVATIE